MRIFTEDDCDLDSPFITGILMLGYHIFSRSNATILNYYPEKFTEYPIVNFKKIRIGNVITVRAFFKIGEEEPVQIDGGYLDLEVEEIGKDHVMAIIVTELPEFFVLNSGDSLEIREDEILTRTSIHDN